MTCWVVTAPTWLSSGLALELDVGFGEGRGHTTMDDIYEDGSIWFGF